MRCASRGRKAKNRCSATRQSCWAVLRHQTQRSWVVVYRDKYTQSRVCDRHTTSQTNRQIHSQTCTHTFRHTFKHTESKRHRTEPGQARTEKLAGRHIIKASHLTYKSWRERRACSVIVDAHTHTRHNYYRNLTKHTLHLFLTSSHPSTVFHLSDYKRGSL